MQRWGSSSLQGKNLGYSRLPHSNTVGCMVCRCQDSGYNIQRYMILGGSLVSGRSDREKKTSPTAAAVSFVFVFV